MTEHVRFTYRAFLSYSHRDRAWADWLHGALESYRIDDHLVGRDTAAGPVPRTLAPIFRDRDDFAAGHSLTEQTLSALAASQFLVVICSPNAAKSDYVNEEIRRFKDMGRAERVVAIIVDGEPGDPERECFPPALRFRLGPDGALTNEREEPIAADARKQGDGKRLALQKVVAGLLGVSFDDVRKRDAIKDSLKVKIGASAAAVVAVLILVAGFLYFEQERRTARDDARDKQIEAITSILVSRAQASPGQQFALNDAVTAAAKGAALGDGRLKMALELLKSHKIAEAEALFRAVAEEKEARARQDNTDAAAAYRNLGAIAGLANPKRAREAYGRAVALDPDDREALYWHGWLQSLAGNLITAESELKKLLQLSLRTNDERGVYRAHLRLAEISLERGNVELARQGFETAHQIAQRNVKQGGDDREWEQDLARSEGYIGDVHLEQGNLDAALRSYDLSRAVVERLVAADPNNTSWQRLLSATLWYRANLMAQKGEFGPALQELERAFAITVRLTRLQPDNAYWQRDIGTHYGRIGDIQAEQGNLAEALTSFLNGFAVADRLVKSDPDNATWQRDLSGFHVRIGDTQLAQRENAEALRSFLAGHAIYERVVTLDPGNATLQRELMVAYNRIGEAQVAHGNLADALRAFRNSLAILERLAPTDLSDIRFQHDLVVAHYRIGDVLLAQDNKSEALKSFHSSVAVAERLAKMDPGNVRGRTNWVAAVWRLAENEDGAAWRWPLIVDELRKLKAEDKLAAEQAVWLLAAEQRLKDVTNK